MAQRAERSEGRMFRTGYYFSKVCFGADRNEDRFLQLLPHSTRSDQTADEHVRAVEPSGQSHCLRDGAARAATDAAGDETAAETISAMLAVFGRIDPQLRRSITFDNDTAFARHRLLRTMRDMTTWFCVAKRRHRKRHWTLTSMAGYRPDIRPRHPGDRPHDEPHPRKCLGFKTPFQAWIAELGKDVQIRFSQARCASLRNPGIWIRSA